MCLCQHVHVFVYECDSVCILKWGPVREYTCVTVHMNVCVPECRVCVCACASVSAIMCECACECVCAYVRACVQG